MKTTSVRKEKMMLIGMERRKLIKMEMKRRKESRRWMLKDCLKTRQGSQDLKKSKDCYIQERS